MDQKVLNSIELIDWGVAEWALQNQAESGDSYLVKPYPGGVLLAAVDGLGHGEEAAAAARAAVAAMSQYTHGSLISLVTQCHQELEDTRGVVMTLASLDVVGEMITWLGIGNVEGVLLRVSENNIPTRKSVLLRSGVVGYQLPMLHASVVPVIRGDILILATDGIRNDFMQELSLNDSPQQMANRILAKYGKETDDALVLVVRYLGRSS